MLLGLRTIIYPVTDLARAKEWYTALAGHGPYFDEPFYVGFAVGGFELGLDPNGTPPASLGGPVTYWGVEEIEAVHRRLRDLGAGEREPVRDVGDGIRVATLTDPFGNAIGIIQNPYFSLENVR